MDKPRCMYAARARVWVRLVPRKIVRRPQQVDCCVSSTLPRTLGLDVEERLVPLYSACTISSQKEPPCPGVPLPHVRIYYTLLLYDVSMHH
jgi:hypothetical protein